jgi:mannose-6-phosphate isomerase
MARKQSSGDESATLFHPIQFQPIGKSRPWGGDALQRQYGKPFKKSDTIGESWELAHRPEESSVAGAGPYKGKSLADLIEEFPEEMIGRDYGLKYRRKFPVLIKLLHCQEYLSIQVHPSDEFASRFESEGNGKMEAWYVVDCPEGSKIFRGILPGTTPEEFKRMAEEGSLIDCLNEVDVKPGDVVFMPPGTVHTAGGGITLFEVSQNCDLTYRLFDWDRGRMSDDEKQLHAAKGMQMIDFYSMGISKLKPIPVKDIKDHKRFILVKSDKFSVDSMELTKKTVNIEAHPERFHAYTVLKGKGEIKYGPKKNLSIAFGENETIFVPAATGPYAIKAAGNAHILDTYVG